MAARRREMPITGNSQWKRSTWWAFSFLITSQRKRLDHESSGPEVRAAVSACRLLAHTAHATAQGSEVSVDDILWAVGLEMVKVPIPPEKVVYAEFFLTVHRRDRIEPVEKLKLLASMPPAGTKLDVTARAAFGCGMENLVKSHDFVVTLNLILLDHIPE